jgi:two-component system, NarL family, response regulator LiaR
MDAGRLRLVIADSDPLVRAVLRTEFEAAGMMVIAEASTCHEALRVTLAHRPDVLVLDFLMSDGCTTDVIGAVDEGTGGEVHTVVLTAVEDEEEGVAVLRAGASGWLSKGMRLKELARAVQRVPEGEAAVTRRFARVLVERVRLAPAVGRGMRPVRTPLTAREWEVLDLMCEEVEDQRIAQALAMSRATLRSHIRSLVRKLKADSRDEAIRAANTLRAVG